MNLKQMWYGFHIMMALHDGAALWWGKMASFFFFQGGNSEVVTAVGAAVEK